MTDRIINGKIIKALLFVIMFSSTTVHSIFMPVTRRLIYTQK